MDEAVLAPMIASIEIYMVNLPRKSVKRFGLPAGTPREFSMA
jgi:hypothetical protein